MIDLSGQVALVTGSSRGIGRACALRLAEAGADVVVNYVTSRTAAEEVANEIRSLGRRTAVVKADVSEQDDVVAMIDFIRDTFARLDILVSNAATGGFRPLLATNPRHFEAAMNTNVRALLYLVQAAMPLLERSSGRAKVIALSSQGADRAQAKYGLVGSTKAAMESLIRHLALEIGKCGINLNVIRAGLVETDSFEQMPDHETILTRQKDRNMVRDEPVRPREVADALLYLASPLSDMVQAHTLVVDGGTSVNGK
jgi:enoyl-[acyl-carrier protein] reductase III